MLLYNVANLVTVIMNNVIHEMCSVYGTGRITTVRIWHQVTWRAGQRS